METIFVCLAIVFIIGIILIFCGKKKDDENQKENQKYEEVLVQPELDTLPTMTLQELSKFDGKQNKKVYLACKGLVFDVSESEFYVGEGGYSAFAGKDCSVNLARMSFEANDYNKYGQVDLTLSERDVLDQWYEKYYYKYRIVAKISETKKDN
ncbi:hypothetical protein ABPG72_013331 [Tetrahymena utriculariae]